MAKRRKIAETPRFEREWAKIERREPRASEAIQGLRGVLRSRPELGMAVPGEPDVSSYPIHLDQGTYVVVYHFDDKTVTLIAVRKAVRDLFGDP